MPKRLLVLGGTSEAVALATALAELADMHVVYSLRGSTRQPTPVPCAVRRGGFGGSDGLASFLKDEGIDALIDATHPYAATISLSAAKACDAVDTPRLVLTRAAWTPVEGDRWLTLPDTLAAARLAQRRGARVLLTIGSRGLEPWLETSTVSGLIRTIEPPSVAMSNPAFRLLMARGPFSEHEELSLMRREHIDLLVTKNSGGASTVAKLVAARTLGIEVAMLARPAAPTGTTVHTIDGALAWLAAI